MPIHGNQPFVGEQIAALAAQSYDGWWELIVADNGCDESTRAVLESHRPRPERVRVVDARARKGACYARNQGVSDAEGDLIAICDSDDVVTPQWIERLVDAAADAEMVGGHVDYAELNTPDAVAWRSSLTDGELPVQLDFLPFAVGSNMALWRDVYDAVGGCDEEIVGGRGGDDVDLSWRVQLAGGRLAWAPDAVIHYRLRPDLRSLTRQMYGYGQSSAMLYRNFRRYGAKSLPFLTVAHFWLHVVRRAPGLLHDRGSGGNKLMQCAYRAGALRGGIRHRVAFW